MLLSTITFFLFLTTSSSLDTLTVHQNITDGETISSVNERYEMGFFSPGSSKNRYLGIWFKNTTPCTVIWVANRETPLKNRLGMVKLGNLGNLSIVNGGGTIVWSSNSSAPSTFAKPIAQLLGSGNLVIKDEVSHDEEDFIWQSFDYPGDTIVPGMKLGKNLITGREMYLTSWKSYVDPSPGDYALRFLMFKDKYPQSYLWKNSVKLYRSGPYNGIEFAGQPNYNPKDKDNMVLSKADMYFQLMHISPVFSLLIKLTPDGKDNTSHLIMQNHEWIQDLVLPNDKCDEYGLCGPNGICSSSVTPPYCECFKGFEQISTPNKTSPGNWTIGCRRSRPLNCEIRAGFILYSSLKLPDTQNAVYDRSMSLQECEVACKNNCSCTAYANPNITTGAVGCLLWFGDLIDVRVYQVTGQDLYVRMAASELLNTHSKFPRKKRVIIAVTSSISVAFAGLMALYIWSKMKKRSDVERKGRPGRALNKDNKSSSMKENIELPLFTLSQISEATNKFDIKNKLGEGGFGPVYKGMLHGQEIAVKLLSTSSRQGVDEFKNEVTCIAKLQHRNLVKLLGYCSEDDETILIYEYMPNKSLDSYIFGWLSLKPTELIYENV